MNPPFLMSHIAMSVEDY